MSWPALGRTIGLAACLLSFSSCGDQLGASRSPSILVIERIGAARRGTTEEPVPTLLQSDVLTFGGVFEDIARVTTRLAFKDPGTAETPTSPTTANWITVTRYRVVYVRADGRNTPGVDVPYPFDGGVTFTTLSGIQSAEFTLVRGQAKLESPLIELTGLGGQIVISTIAEITFFGQDQAGTAVSATGTIGINFADWADPFPSG